MDGSTEGKKGPARDAAQRGGAPDDGGGLVALDEPLLDCTRAAALLGVRVSWVRDAARLGQLPCLRLGRHMRFSRRMLEAWLAEQDTQTRAMPSMARRAARRSNGARHAVARSRRSRETTRLIAGLEQPAGGNREEVS
jgi:excisionase family DNA binding protein